MDEFTASAVHAVVALMALACTAFCAWFVIKLFRDL